MKKVFLVAILAILCGFVANAQYSSSPSTSGVNLSTDFFGQVFADGKKLTNEDLAKYLDAYQYADLSTPLRKTKQGLVYTGVGVGLIATHFVLYEFSDSVLLDYFVTVPCFIGGVVFTCIGIPKFFINKSKVNKVIDNYNQKNTQATLSLGAQQYGYGLALTF